MVRKAGSLVSSARFRNGNKDSVQILLLQVLHTGRVDLISLPPAGATEPLRVWGTAPYFYKPDTRL